jgi:phage shock protein E
MSNRVTPNASTGPRFRGAPVDLVLDVRTKIEFWTGHLHGAVCIPVDRLPGGLARLGDVSHASRILVYCGSGQRSAAAAEELRKAGYRNVVDGGGLAAARADFSP